MLEAAGGRGTQERRGHAFRPLGVLRVFIPGRVLGSLCPARLSSSPRRPLSWACGDPALRCPTSPVPPVPGSSPLLRRKGCVSLDGRAGGARMGEKAGASKEAAERVRWCVQGATGDGGRLWEGVWARAAPLPSMLSLDLARPTPRRELRSLRGRSGCGVWSPQGWRDVVRRGLGGQSCQGGCGRWQKTQPERWRPGSGEGRAGGRKT